VGRARLDVHPGTGSVYDAPVTSGTSARIADVTEPWSAWAGGFLIFVLSSDADDSFWSPLGVLGVVVTALGLVLLVVGLFTPTADASGTVRRTKQSQRGGKGSRNYQVGGDMHIRQDERE
jgi:hypothetical protein